MRLQLIRIIIHLARTTKLLRSSLEPPPLPPADHRPSSSFHLINDFFLASIHLINNFIDSSMEITVISAQGLKKSSSLFSHYLRPFITLTTTPPSSSSHGRDYVYTTTVDHQGGVNPTWVDKFDLSNIIDATFFYHKYSYIYLELYTKRLFLGPRFLGWCGIPAADLADGFSPAGTVRRLSYRLRKKDGSRGHGVVNVVVKVESSIFRQQGRVVDSDVRRLPEMNFGRVAIGIPVKMLPAVGTSSKV